MRKIAFTFLLLCLAADRLNGETLEGNIEWTGKVLKSVDSEESNVIPNEEDPEPQEQKLKLSNKEIYANLKKRLKSIKESCGEVCNTDDEGVEGKYYKSIKKNINCEALFSNPDIDAPGEFQIPPRKIPKYLLPDFTHNGKLRVMSEYRDDANGATHYTHWSQEILDFIQVAYENNNLTGPYGIGSVESIKHYIDEHFPVKDKHVLVMGSQTPWVELILLNKGAKKVTTFDYVKIQSDHPQIEVLTPDELSEKFLKEHVQYDAMVTISSLEHSGLGRYGDMLNPWGHLITMARAWCLVKPGGKALLSATTGPDILMFNSHRLFGPFLFSQLFANWETLYTERDWSLFNATGCSHCYEPLHVLERL